MTWPSGEDARNTWQAGQPSSGRVEWVPEHERRFYGGAFYTVPTCSRCGSRDSAAYSLVGGVLACDGCCDALDERAAA